MQHLLRLPLRILLVVLLLISTYHSDAQRNEPYIYTELGWGYGNEGMFKATLNGVFARNNIVSFSYCFASKNASNIPADYNPNGFLFGPTWPRQSVSMAGLSYGKVLFTHTSYIRYTLKAGFIAGTV